MEPGPSDVIGSFFYIDWATDDINNIYTNSFSSEALSGFAQPYIVLDPKPALQFKAAEESSSDSSIGSSFPSIPLRFPSLARPTFSFSL